MNTLEGLYRRPYTLGMQSSDYLPAPIDKTDDSMMRTSSLIPVLSIIPPLSIPYHEPHFSAELLRGYGNLVAESLTPIDLFSLRNSTEMKLVGWLIQGSHNVAGSDSLLTCRVVCSAMPTYNFSSLTSHISSSSSSTAFFPCPFSFRIGISSSPPIAIACRPALLSSRNSLRRFLPSSNA